MTAEVSAADGAAKTRSKLVAFAAAAIVLLLLLEGSWSSLNQLGIPMDEGMVLVYPELVAHGQIPYRDFESFYGPANPYFLAGVYSIFGTNIFTERGVTLFYRMVAALAIFGIARRWGTPLAAGAMLIASAFLICTHLIASAWVAAMGCVLAGLWIISSNGRFRLLFAGLLGGVALLFRPDVAPALLLSVTPFLWRASWRERGHYFAGFAAAMIPFVLLTFAAGLTNVWNNLFFYPVIASNPGRRLPLGSAEPYLVKLLALHLIGSVGIAIAGFLEWRKEQDSTKARVLFSAAGLALALTPQAVQRLDLGHLFFAGIVSLPFIPIAIADLVKRATPPASHRYVAAAAVVATIGLIEGLAPEVGTIVRDAYTEGLATGDVGARFVQHDGRRFVFRNPTIARYTSTLCEELKARSKPGERLFVGPADLRRTNYCDTFIYHLFPQLRPASYFLEMNPFSANRPGSRLAADISTADWVILNRMWDNWNEPNRSKEYGDDAPNKVMHAAFTLVAESGPYLLFQRKPTADR